jgi:hypothetical protein
MNSILERHTSKSLLSTMLPQFFNGCGNIAGGDIYFSYGCYFMILLIQENFLRERTWSFLTTIVSCAILTLKKSLLHLFFQYSFYIVFMGGRSMNRSLHLGMITTTSFHSPPDKAPNFRTTKRSSKTITPNPYSSY